MIKKLVAAFFTCLIGCSAILLILKEERSSDSILQEEKKFVVIIPSYNNSKWYEKNLGSVFSQHYSNYRVIYIDDCSTDDTYELVKSYIEKNKQADRVTLIRNKTRRGHMANHFKAGHMCEDDEIIVHLDGDDWLKHNYVLQKLNQVYANPYVWMTYGQYEVYPGGRRGACREFPAIVHQKNCYREFEWISSHLRTCYAWLFKRIKLKDCLFYGTWLPVAVDKLMMFSMLEMAREHGKFIPDILYVYNCATPTNLYKQNLLLARNCNSTIESRKKYERIKTEPRQQDNLDTTKINMIIFSDDNPLLLQAVIESSHKYLSGIQHINVCYHTSTDAFKKAYEDLQKQHNDISFNFYKKGPKPNLAQQVEQIIAQSDYILFVHDGIIIKEPIDLQNCAKALKKTAAYGFYFTLGKNITKHHSLKRPQKLPPFIDLEDGIYAWQFEYGEFSWKKPQTLSLALYNAHDVKRALSNIVYDAPELLESLWSSILFDMSDVGLIHENAPAFIHISL